MDKQNRSEYTANLELVADRKPKWQEPSRCARPVSSNPKRGFFAKLLKGK